MAFVPEYKHDIFVSYAHVDDLTIPGVEEGWVTTLVKGLKARLAQILGHNNAFSLWMDHQLSRHVKITPEIMSILQETATLVVILSPGYLASDWCMREKDTFLKMVGDRVRSGSRVFIVERDKIAQNQRPTELKDLLGYHFWVQDREGKPPRILGTPKPDPNDRPYYDLIDDLAYDLAKELKRLKEAAKSSPSEIAKKDTGPIVFLAEVTDDLDDLRKEVKRSLNQAGIHVLPQTWYSREPSAFRQAAEKDIAECKVFVQLFSGIAGKKSPDLPQGYAGLQYDVAKNLGKPILQWRSRKLDINSIKDKDHRAILELDTVHAVRIEEFKREIVNLAFYKPPPPPPADQLNAFLFVNTEASDRLLAKTVCKALDKYGVEYALTLEKGEPADIRKDLEENLIECDILIIIYGCISAAWVREQLRFFRKINFKRKQPLQSLIIYEGPPEGKEPLDFKLKNMRILDCRKGLNEAELISYLDTLKMGR